MKTSILSILAAVLLLLPSCGKKDEGTFVKATGISLNPTTLTLKKGEKVAIKATVTPENATSKYILWTTTDSKKVSVDKFGMVAGVEAGSATITATTQDGGFKGTCTVTVTE